MTVNSRLQSATFTQVGAEEDKKALTQLVFPLPYGVTQRRGGAGVVEGANFQMV